MQDQLRCRYNDCREAHPVADDNEQVTCWACRSSLGLPPVLTFERFTKRTDDPKLAWLERRLDEAGIAHRRNGHSFHAPILEVDASKLDAAWAILTPVDDVEDDDPMFLGDD